MIFRLSVEWIVVLYLSCHLHIVRATVRFVEPVDQAGLNGHTEDTLVLHMLPSYWRAYKKAEGREEW